MNWTEIVTAIVAVYGAILSTYNLLAQLRKNRPSINVKFEMGFLANTRGQASDTMVILNASNSGEKAVTLASYSVLLPDNQTLIPLHPHTLDVTFPHELQPEKQCQVYLPAKELAKTLKSEGFSGKAKLVGLFRDQVDRTHKSKPWEFDINGWAQ